MSYLFDFCLIDGVSGTSLCILETIDSYIEYKSNLQITYYQLPFLIINYNYFFCIPVPIKL